jgi:hypothetical protein
MACLTVALSLVASEPDKYVFLYEDELTYYHRPSVTGGYVEAGEDAPRADQGWSRKKWQRVASSLDVVDGWLYSWQRDAFDARTLLKYLNALEEAVVARHSKVEVIFLALDNWPVHFRSEIPAKLAQSQSKLMLLSLPTYAPWTNPVEKLWHKLYAEVLHLHEHVNNWQALQQRVRSWLDQYADGSPSLLRYVGLYPD